MKKILTLFVTLALFGLSMNHANAQFAGGDGSTTKPYQIATAAQLAKLAELVNAGDDAYNAAAYILNSNLDLAGYQTGEGWTPIGNTPNSFKGTFNGNNKVITGLKINNTTANYLGLFGYVQEGTIKNLGVENADITTTRPSGATIGGIAGSTFDSEITHCYVTGKTTILSSLATDCYAHAGGVVGYFAQNEISHCHSNVSIIISGSAVNTSSVVGGVVAYSEWCKITNCYSTVKISSSVTSPTHSAGSQIGGIVGNTFDTEISGCYAKGIIKSSAKGTTDARCKAGGLVGFDEIGKITNCYSTVDIYGSATTAATTVSVVGGIVAETYGTEISNCYSTGLLSCMATHYSYVGGIVGSFAGTGISNCAGLNPGMICEGTTKSFGRIVGSFDAGTLSNNIGFDKMKSPSGTWDYVGEADNDGEDFTAVQINTNGTLGSRFNPPVWSTENGKLPALFGNTETMPLHLQVGGTETNPFLIYNAKDLKMLANYVNSADANYKDKYYKQMNNIDLSDYQEDEGWTPIGQPGGATFQGNYNGNNKIVTGLKIKAESTNNVYLGLFGLVMNGKIANLGIENAEMVSNHSAIFSELFVGGVAGALINSAIANCYSTGETKCLPTSTKPSIHRVGGMAGLIEMNSTLTGCYSKMTLPAEGLDMSRAGGVVGEMKNGTILNCFATGKITTDAIFTSYAGGVAGSVATGNIHNCYATGEVSSTGTWETFSGGVVGEQTGGNIFNSAGLNKSLSCNGTTIESGRIAGKNTSANLNNNIGFLRMLNPDGTMIWANTGTDKIDGVDISAQAIHDDGKLGGRFSDAVWTTANGKLPGLFGKTVEMPLHLQLTQAQTPVISTQPKNANVEINELHTFKVTAKVTDGGTLTYQWFSNTTESNTGGTAIPSAIATLYTPSTEEKGIFYYYVTVTNTVPDNGNGGILTATIASNPVTLKVGTDGIETIINEGITVYPNPTNGQLRITNYELRIDNVEIFDVFGRKVYDDKNSYDLTVLRSYDLTPFPAGIYFLKITTETGIVTKKIIKN